MVSFPSRPAAPGPPGRKRRHPLNKDHAYTENRTDPVRSVLSQAGIPPAPQRDRQSWRAFLRAHGESILACEFLTVDTVWLRRVYVLVFLSIGNRRVEYVACTNRARHRVDAAAGAQLADGSRRMRGCCRSCQLARCGSWIGRSRFRLVCVPRGTTG